MSVIVFQKVETKEKKISPCYPYSLQEICKLLNDGYAIFHKLCPEGEPLMHDCTHEEQIIRRDTNEIIATVKGSAGATKGCQWKPSEDNSFIEEFNKHVNPNTL